MANGAFHRQIHVLIVDDNSINRRLLIALMTKHAFTFREACNGLAALHLYTSSTSSPTSTPKTTSAPQRFDVILMDLSMPVMDGMTATRKIRAFEREHGWTRTTIIALTGLASASARLEAAECGVDHYLTKPVDFGELMRVIT
jgi:CheY-like chemotaxis protein